MSKTIDIQIGKHYVGSVPVRFPNKCIYCGAPKETTRLRDIERTYQKRNGDFKTYKLKPIEIPYCQKHADEIKAADVIEEKMKTHSFTYILWGIIAILLLIFAYKPIHNSALDIIVPVLGPPFGRIASFISAVTLIVVVLAPIVPFIIGITAGKISRSRMKPPDGLKTKATNRIQFIFENEEIADEFLKLNCDLTL